MRKILYALLFLPAFLVADQADIPVKKGTLIAPPWFTGPLLAPSAVVITKGHYNVEPYLFATAIQGYYNNDWGTVDRPTLWTINPQVYVQIGITKWMDFQFVPSWFWNYRKGASNWEMGDLLTEFDFQLYIDENPDESWIPSIRFSITEKLPLGAYQKLNPKNFRTDIGGGGSWVTGLIMIFSKLFHTYDIHYLNSRLALTLDVPAPVRVKRFNAYGGGYGTDGTVYPGVNFEADLGLEYNLTKRWALALDIVGLWAARNRFSGQAGINFDGSPAVNTSPASSQYSLAPAIEYNWNENLGLIAGSWFTVAGKNVAKFSSAVIAFNYYN